MKKLLLVICVIFSLQGYSQFAGLINCGNNFNLFTNAPATATTTFFLSQSDADSNINAISNPENYTAISSPQIIFARVDENSQVTIVSFSLIVHPAVNITIQQSPDVPVFSLDAVVENTQGSTYYTWTFNGVELSDHNSGILIFGNPSGTYSVTVIDANGCLATTSSYVIGCEIPAPAVVSVVEPNCTNAVGTITLTSQYAEVSYSLDGGPFMVLSGSQPFTVTSPAGLTGYHAYTFYNSEGNCTNSVTVPINYDTTRFEMEGTYVDYNNNGYADVGDIITHSFTIVNNTCNAFNNVSVEIFNEAVAGGPLDLAAGMTDNTTFTGTHIISQTEINSGFVHSVGSLVVNGLLTAEAVIDVPLNISNGIRLEAFADTNGNGIKDAGEQTFTHGEFTYQINNGGTIHHIDANQPFFLYESNPTTAYNLMFSVYGEYSSHYSVSTSYNNIHATAGSGIMTYYFPISVINYNDLAVALVPSGAPPRPGFVYYIDLKFSNNGSQTINSGTVTFTKNGLLTITTNSQPAAINTATGFTYNFTNLLAGESRHISIGLQVPASPNVAIGDILFNMATINFPPSDINTGNNTSNLSQIIVGSYDPNEKSESHGEAVLYSDFNASDYLTYTIRFENTGTANAINVRVEDVLDNQLNENSVRTISASQGYTFERIGKNLSWKFNGINLPPSIANTNTGHGYVVFEVKPQPGYAVGTIIPNTGDIYFDFNPAIVTNTCTTEFVSTLRTEDFAFDNLQYYPNPVKNILTIENGTPMEKVIVLSVLGQQILVQDVNEINAYIDVSVLTQGIYMVKAISNHSTKTFKIIKE